MAYKTTVPEEDEGPCAATPADLREAVGHLCEVRKPNDNKLVFLGRVQGTDIGALAIFPAGGREAPPVIYNDDFKLILHIPRKSTQVWLGKIHGSSRTFWKLGSLSKCHQREQRVNFRQPVSLRANALCINALYPESARGEAQYYARLCKVVDVSLGGVQLRSQDRYRPGDHLLLTNLWLDESQPQPFVFTTQICWAQPVNKVETRFGCFFESMSIRDEDRLCAAILELQRLDLASRSG